VTLRQLPPALVTALTLVCGLAALEAARTADWGLALRLMLVAAVADGTDGMLARRLHAVSPMGAQLDSLADIIAFGVAPAFIFATYYGDAPAVVRFGIAAAFVLGGAYRLARFHARPAHGVFLGLPITAAGALFAVIVAGPLELPSGEAAAVGLALTILMVCHHPFPKIGRSRRVMLPVIAGAAVPILLWPRVETLAILAGFVLVGYVLYGLASAILGDRLPQLGMNEVDASHAGRSRG
jgi:CDP-diacylglycerol--serine O-phosphatidyltransferase